jgi:hypothetical protein
MRIPAQSSRSATSSTGPKPQSHSVPEKTDHPAPGKAPVTQRGQKTEASLNQNTPHHSGGIDSKTQFQVTQNLKKDSGHAPASQPPSPSPAGKPEQSAAAGKIPDSEDENGLTAKQLNTTGPAGAVSVDEIKKASNNDPEITGLLQKLDQDAEGHKALRLALDKGTTYKKGQLDGNVVGLTRYGGNSGPQITLESLSLDTAAHETAHAAYQDMSHAEVYRFGRRVEERLGKGQALAPTISAPTTAGNESNGNRVGGGGSSFVAGNNTFSLPTPRGGHGGGSERRPSSSGFGNPFASLSSPGQGLGNNTPRIRTGTSNGASNIPDSEDENGLTAAQLNTTGAAAPVTDEEIRTAAGGDPEIMALLKKLNEDPEGHKALRLALDQGTTYSKGELEGNVVGLTRYGGNSGPKITLESMSIDTIAHETAHAAYHDMSHAEVYRLGHRVEDRLGKTA